MKIKSEKFKGLATPYDSLYCMIYHFSNKSPFLGPTQITNSNAYARNIDSKIWKVTGSKAYEKVQTERNIIMRVPDSWE